MDEGAKNCSITNSQVDYSNRQSWKAAQMSNEACKVAIKLLTSGKPPPKAMGKTSGEYWNDVRQYCRDASVAKDGLLVVKAQSDVVSGNLVRDRIVIPRPLVPALLYHLHNHNDAHPPKTQQKSLFQRQFYAITLDNHLNLLYKNCYKCSVIQKIPHQVIPNETKTVVDGPQTHFHIDVIKQASQNILTIRDHFSSYQDAILIDSEKAIDLKNGLILLTSTMRRPSQIFVSADNSPGFKSLLTNSDDDLKKLNILMVKTDEINKNANAVIDKGCQEIENELKRLEPEGAKIDISTLKLAVLNLNSKLRRRGTISSFEINTARDQNTGINLQLDDKLLRNQQIESRKDRNIETNQPSIHIGDTVKIKNKSDKHKANEMFIVTSKDENNDVGIQKLLHPLKQQGKIMSKVYTTNQKHLVTIPKPEHPNADNDSDNEDIQLPTKMHKKPWNPINQKFFDDDSDDE